MVSPNGALQPLHDCKKHWPIYYVPTILAIDTSTLATAYFSGANLFYIIYIILLYSLVLYYRLLYDHIL